MNRRFRNGYNGLDVIPPIDIADFQAVEVRETVEQLSELGEVCKNDIGDGKCAYIGIGLSKEGYDFRSKPAHVLAYKGHCVDVWK